jgi:hypothetical protein
VYGKRRRYEGELIGRCIPEFFTAELAGVSGVGESQTTADYGIPRAPGEPAPPAAPGRPPEDGAVDRERFPDVTVGDGYAVGMIDDAGDGYGFRKARRALGVTFFGVNALVREPGYETRWHYHDLQEELYFVHHGAIEMDSGDGNTHRLQPGAFARVDADGGLCPVA